MELSEMSAREVLKAFFESYRNQDFESLRLLCTDNITYINPEGLSSNGIDEFLQLLKKEFESFGVLFEPISWESSVERPSYCYLSWKRGVKFARIAALRRVETFGSAFLLKVEKKWQLVHFQQAFSGSYSRLLRTRKK